MENNENKLSTWKILLIVVLWLLILIWLFWAWCWGLFTISFLLWNWWWYDFYIISIPSLIIWLLLIFWGYIWIKKILKSRKLGNENNTKLSTSQKSLIISFWILLITLIIYWTSIFFWLSMISLVIIWIFLIFWLFIWIYTFMKPKKIIENKPENTEKIIENEKNNHIEL